ncbi:hypothetical protein AB0M50_14670 [Nonomuraea fuscirosea]
MAPASIALESSQANCVVSKASRSCGRTKVGEASTVSTMTFTRTRTAT